MRYLWAFFKGLRGLKKWTSNQSGGRQSRLHPLGEGVARRRGWKLFDGYKEMLYLLKQLRLKARDN